jgi:predicted site-specific integrase-resolvase
MPETKSKWVRPAEAATELGIAPGTMDKWIKAGCLKLYRPPWSQKGMLLRAEVERVYREVPPKATPRI